MTTIIAIDGPAGSGKSTIAKELAKELNYAYLDTGGMYRTITYYLLTNNIDLNDTQSVIEKLKNINIDYKDNQYYLDGVELTTQIRTPEINQNVSNVAAIKEVREFSVEKQRELSKKYNTILDGRDIASVVFPNADYKFYLDASAQTRAQRRYDENKDTNNEQTYEQVLNDIEKRDEIDKNRAESPLIQVEEAIYIDTSELSISDVLNLLKKEIEVK